MISQQKQHKPAPDRIVSLDILRGLAVLVMVLAHGIYFFHDNSNSLFRIISRTGNIFAFTMFLFVSGAATYMAHLSSDERTRNDTRAIFKRTLTILSGYYVVAFASVMQDLIAQGTGAVSYIIDILTLSRVPSFSEFLLPFVIFHLSLIFLKPFYRFVTKNVLSVTAVSLIMYLAGSALYSAPVPDVLQPYLAIFAGREGYLRFPVLQYFPIFIFGMYWGRTLFNPSHAAGIISRAMALGAAAWSISAATFFIPALNSIQFFNPMNRWPPSIGFLAEGLAFIFLFETVFPVLVMIIRNGRFWGIISYMGRDSFDMYIVHMLILFLYKFVYTGVFGNPAAVIFFTAALLTSTILLSSVNITAFKTAESDRFMTLGLHGRYRLKKRYVTMVFLMFLMLFVQVHALNTDITTGGIIRQRDLPQTELSLLPFQDNGIYGSWFHEDYGFKKRLVIRNTGFAEIKKGTTVSVTFDHRSLVMDGKSRKDAGDITLVYRSDLGFEMLSAKSERPNLPNTIIRFPLVRAIRAGMSDAGYELYYGSDFPLPPLSEPPPQADGVLFEPSFEDEQEKGLIVKKNRTWFMTGNEEEPSELIITVQSPDSGRTLTEILTREERTERYKFTIPSIGRSGFLTGPTEGPFTATIPLSEVAEGVYALKVTDTETGTISPSVKIAVTSPVYVAITFDWEGYDVPDSVLSRIEVLTDTHNKLPFTHFFSPRIYVTGEVSPERANVLTRFIRNRLQTNGDALGMHLHMHEDILTAAGVTPRQEPRWGYLSAGYDVPTTVYTEDELYNLLTYARSLFSANGLPLPVGYRTGGWFTDLHVFRALEKAGFAYDSSGRDRESWVGKIKSPWSLSPVTQPYFPSRSDINSGRSDPFAVFEIPNNGGNTFEQDAPDLIRRLLQNIPEGISREKKSVVFLSHPQFADREFARLNRLLTYLDDMLYMHDAGPVVYTTVEHIHSLWTGL